MLVRQLCHLSAQVSLQVSTKKEKEMAKDFSLWHGFENKPEMLSAGLCDCNWVIVVESTALQVCGPGRDRRPGKASATK